MNLPHGNVLLKPTALQYQDIQKKLENLRNHHFNGYVQVALSETSYRVFLCEGEIQSIVETREDIPALISELLFHYQIRNSSGFTSSYVLAANFVKILSCCYAFQEKFLNYQIHKKEFQQLLHLLDSEKITGMIEIHLAAASELIYLLLQQGEIATDVFLDSYGQILAGPDKISEIMSTLAEKGGVVNAYGESPEQIEKKKKMMQEELNQYRELSILAESARFLFLGGSGVHVEEEILREWSQDRLIQKVEILTQHDSSHLFKVMGKRGLGNKISMPVSIQKTLGVTKDEVVLVHPVSAL